MFYEDFRVGQSADFGSATFSREAILAYGRRFDPRIVAPAAAGSEPVAASGLHVAAQAMRRLVDSRNALRAAMAQRGESLPELGVSPGFREMRWPAPGVRRRRCLLFDGDRVETRDFQGEMGAHRQQISRRQPTGRGSPGLFERRSRRSARRRNLVACASKVGGRPVPAPSYAIPLPLRGRARVGGRAMA